MRTEVQSVDIAALVHEFQSGSRAALSRLLTIAAAGLETAALAGALASLPKTNTPVIAFTGSGGVGKSSLLGAVTVYFAGRDERVGVLACDPESPVTGGALLGDRCRIAGASLPAQVFIRSLSAAAGQQGLAPNIDLMLDLMRAFGFHRIFLETVGVGQSDVAVRGVADVVVLVVQPQTGDDLQWEKAGVLEVADVVVVNKSDLQGADQTIADIAQQLRRADGAVTPVIKTSVARDEGIVELCKVLEKAMESHAEARRTRR